MVSQMCRVITVCACVVASGHTLLHGHDGVLPHQELIITHQEERDLELFAARDGSPGVVDFFDYTVTRRGHEHLQALFKHPVVDYQKVCQRQAQIRYLVEHEELCKKMREFFQVIANAERGLYGEATDIEHQVVSNFYYDWSWSNRSDILLTIRYYASTALLAMPTVEHLVFHFLLSEKLKDTLGLACACGGHDHTHNHEGAQAVYSLYTCIHMGFHIMGVIELIKQIRERNSYLELMRERLRLLYAVFNALEDLSDCIYENQELYAYYKQYENMRILLDLPEKISIMRKELSHVVDAWAPSSGLLLRLYQECIAIKNDVEVLLDCVGHIEADVSCAQTYIQLQQEGLPCAFVRFIDQQYPVLRCNNAWHPLLGYFAASAIAVDFGTQWSGALVTGDNMTGKSTLLKTCGVTIMSALATGFVLADDAEMTPPKALCTSLCLDDMLTQGLSKYAAELQRADSIQKIIESVNAPVFVLIDELFIATRPEKGKKALAEFLDMLFAQPHVIGCVATHYHDVAQYVCNSYPAVASVVASYKDGVYRYACGM